jgi:hypothetical protein
MPTAEGERADARLLQDRYRKCRAQLKLMLLASNSNPVIAYANSTVQFLSTVSSGMFPLSHKNGKNYGCDKFNGSVVHGCSFFYFR